MNKNDQNILKFRSKNNPGTEKSLEQLEQAIAKVDIREANSLPTSKAKRELVVAMIEQMEDLDFSEIDERDARLEHELEKLVPNPGQPSLGLFHRYFELQQEYLKPGFLSDPVRLEMLSFIWSKLQWVVTTMMIKSDLPDPYCEKEEWGAADYNDEAFWENNQSIIEDSLLSDIKEVHRLMWGDDLAALKNMTSITHLGFFSAEWELSEPC